MLPKEVFDEYSKKYMKELLEKGHLPTVIGGFIDYFGDAKTVDCVVCGTPVFLRPWLAQIVQDRNLRVQCICCADPQEVKSRIIMDSAKIEAEVKSEKAK